MPFRGWRVSSPIRTLGCMVLALPPVWFFLGGIIHVFASARAKAHQSICLSNVKQIGLGVLQYTADWDETYPPSPQWGALSDKYVEKTNVAAAWHCPESASPFSYASNQAVGGKAIKDMDELAATIYLFECDAATWNAAGGKGRLPQRERHNGANIYFFLDGHARWCNQYWLKEARWQPLFIPQEKKP